jgi:hypothetical protein
MKNTTPTPNHPFDGFDKPGRQAQGHKRLIASRLRVSPFDKLRVFDEGPRQTNWRDQSAIVNPVARGGVVAS